MAPGIFIQSPWKLLLKKNKESRSIVQVCDLCSKDLVNCRAQLKKEICTCVPGLKTSLEHFLKFSQAQDCINVPGAQFFFLFVNSYLLCSDLLLFYLNTQVAKCNVRTSGLHHYPIEWVTRVHTIFCPLFTARKSITDQRTVIASPNSEGGRLKIFWWIWINLSTCKARIIHTWCTLIRSTPHPTAHRHLVLPARDRWFTNTQREDDVVNGHAVAK